MWEGIEGVTLWIILLRNFSSCVVVNSYAIFNFFLNFNLTFEIYLKQSRVNHSFIFYWILPKKISTSSINFKFPSKEFQSIKNHSKQREIPQRWVMFKKSCMYMRNSLRKIHQGDGSCEWIFKKKVSASLN